MLNMNFEMIDGVFLARLPDVYAPFTVPEGKVKIIQDQGSSTQLQRVSHKEYSAVRKTSTPPPPSPCPSPPQGRRSPTTPPGGRSPSDGPPPPPGEGQGGGGYEGITAKRNQPA